MWIGNCEIVLPDGVLPHGAVRVEEGFIAEISPSQRLTLMVMACSSCQVWSTCMVI